jgi:hypothetical protein
VLGSGVAVAANGNVRTEVPRMEGTALLPVITPLKLNVLLLPAAAAAAAAASISIQQQIDRGNCIVITKLNNMGEPKWRHNSEYKHALQDAAKKGQFVAVTWSDWSASASLNPASIKD